MVEACENCRFWKGGPEEDEGLCRRHTPIAVENSAAFFPVTWIDDWCGEWEPISKAEPDHGEFVTWGEFKILAKHGQLSGRAKNCIESEFHDRSGFFWNELTEHRMRGTRNAGEKTLAAIMTWKESTMQKLASLKESKEPQ